MTGFGVNSVRVRRPLIVSLILHACAHMLGGEQTVRRKMPAALLNPTQRSLRTFAGAHIGTEIYITYMLRCCHRNSVRLPQLECQHTIHTTHVPLASKACRSAPKAPQRSRVRAKISVCQKRDMEGFASLVHLYQGCILRWSY